MTAVSKSSTKSSKRRSAQTSGDAPQIAVMDTNLRDGEQKPNVSYTPAEKLQHARMLHDDLEVDRIENVTNRLTTVEPESANTHTKVAPKDRPSQPRQKLS